MSDRVYTILFVDDDLIMLNMVKSVFKPIDSFRFLTASNANDAMKMYEPHVVLILLDIHLDEEYLSGIRITSSLRSMNFKGIICMFTGDASPTLLFQSVLAGANDYILKGPACNITEEVTRLIKLGKDDCGGTEVNGRNPIEESAYLRSTGLTQKETMLLKEFADYEYQRIKEFAVQLNVTETCLWKRIARIRDKLQMDSTAQIAHLLTSLSMMDIANKRWQTADNPSTMLPQQY